MEGEQHPNDVPPLSETDIAQLLSERYEGIYVIDATTGAYSCYHESEDHERLGFASSGSDFYQAIEDELADTVHADDLRYLARMLGREAVLAGTEGSSSYSFEHHMSMADGTVRHHRVEATRRMMGGRDCVVLGIRDAEHAYLRRREQRGLRESAAQREHNLLEAILASSMGYLEANVSRDVVLDRSRTRPLENDVPKEWAAGAEVSLTRFMRWWGEMRVVRGTEAFLRANEASYLLEHFGRGERRVSVSFSIMTSDGTTHPCRQVAYLYRDGTTGDVMCLNVVYDLTQTQRREQEMRELEEELRLSRIRAITGQMRPHFLYNALGSIQEVMLDDPAYAAQLLDDFSTHLRGSVRAMSSDDPIPFSSELENVRAYANIERMRLGERLRMHYDVGPRDFLVPPLTIQPLVENAIRHGVYGRGPAGGSVRLATREEGDAWVVEVADDGVGFDVRALEAAGGTGSTGLRNLRFRLEKIMGAQVEVRSTPGIGTRATVRLPKDGSHAGIEHRDAIAGQGTPGGDAP